MYLQGKGESENLLRLLKILTFVLATTGKSTYLLVTISRTESDLMPEGSGLLVGRMAQSWTSHRMEGMGERERRSGQGDP